MLRLFGTVIGKQIRFLPLDGGELGKSHHIREKWG